MSASKIFCAWAGRYDWRKIIPGLSGMILRQSQRQASLKKSRGTFRINNSMYHIPENF